jgi:hypothetical protein
MSSLGIYLPPSLHHPPPLYCMYYCFDIQYTAQQRRLGTALLLKCSPCPVVAGFPTWTVQVQYIRYLGGGGIPNVHLQEI